MSYARFGRHSDVYVYPDPDGRLICCRCELSPSKLRDEFICATPREMVAHLKEHQGAGHKVPLDAIAELQAEAGLR